MDRHSVASRNAGVIGEELEGELVLLVPHTGETMVLNHTGTGVWSLLDGSRTLAEVAEAMATKFVVSPADAYDDLLAFVGQLLERDLVHLAPQ